MVEDLLFRQIPFGRTFIWYKLLPVTNMYVMYLGLGSDLDNTHEESKMLPLRHEGSTQNRPVLMLLVFFHFYLHL